jgi:hypothetical protein
MDTCGASSSPRGSDVRTLRDYTISFWMARRCLRTARRFPHAAGSHQRREEFRDSSKKRNEQSGLAQQRTRPSCPLTKRSQYERAIAVITASQPSGCQHTFSRNSLRSRESSQDWEHRARCRLSPAMSLASGLRPDSRRSRSNWRSSTSSRCADAAADEPKPRADAATTPAPRPWRTRPDGHGRAAAELRQRQGRRRKGASSDPPTAQRTGSRLIVPCAVQRFLVSARARET